MSQCSSVLVLLLVSASLSAAEPVARANPEIGVQTQRWLELQNSNNAAQGTARPLPGEVADAIYERYVNSFRHPIPVQFERESFNTGSSGQ
ncbi:MAG TPA: DUF3613 domain-containing protein [Nevskiaceae bacterium]|nr:DUF3613 domain-containing protein [Nevskiaceae bacterium]